MRKLIAAINMTLDGFCDHTYGIADEELHEYYKDLLNNSGTILYGRITYQLMESYWPGIVKSPTGDKSTDDFAMAIQNIPKIVFSRTLDNISWENTTLAKGTLEEEVSALKQASGRDILVGSPGLIAALTNLNLIEEYRLCIHPVIAGKGLTLFREMTRSIVLKLLGTKAFSAGQVVHYYKSVES